MSLVLFEREKVRQAVVAAGVWRSGHAVLNSERHSDVLLDMRKLLNNPDALHLVQSGIRRLARSQPNRPNKVIIPVPNGAADIMTAGRRAEDFGIGVIRPTKIGKREFAFSEDDLPYLKRLGRAAIVEDVVTTGGSSAALVRIIHEIAPDVALDLVGVWRRSELLPENQAEFETQAYLVEELIPDWPADECSCTTSQEMS